MQPKQYLDSPKVIAGSPAVSRENEQSGANQNILGKRVDAAGWGVLFLWVGVALLAGTGLGLGLLGVGIITLSLQAARRYYALKWEGFWVVVGLLNVLCGVWLLFNLRVALVPILCLVTGVILVLSALAGKVRD